MRRAWVLAWILALAACAGDAAAAPFTGNVFTGVPLGLTAADRLQVGHTPGIWVAERDGDIIRLTETHLVGDEGGIEQLLELDVSQNPPRVVRGFIEVRDAYTEDRVIPVVDGVVELQEADPDGVIAGQWIGEAGGVMFFWVDMAEHADARIEVGRTFTLRPGGYATFDGTLVFHYVGVIEDSRCPPDVTCVWEGAVSVEGRVWDFDVQRTVTLEGIATESGPMHGTRPTDLLRDGLAITLTGVDEAGTATFLVEASG